MSASLTADWPGDATRFLGLRLLPGTDLRAGLQEAFAREPETGGFVTACVGSLDRAVLRMAGEDRGTAIDGPFEIVSLSGSFSMDGPHLHLSVADRRGTVIGGHLLAGCPVRTTAEVVLALVTGPRFTRAVDVRTGYAELFFDTDAD